MPVSLGLSREKMNLGRSEVVMSWLEFRSTFAQLWFREQATVKIEVHDQSQSHRDTQCSFPFHSLILFYARNTAEVEGCVAGVHPFSNAPSQDTLSNAIHLSGTNVQ